MIKGDINNDGLINDMDTKLLQYAIANIFKLNDQQIKAADVDNNNKINMHDLATLQNMIHNTLPGDVNGDGVVDAKDAQLFKKEVLKLLRLDKYVQEGDVTLCVIDTLYLQKLIEGIIASYKEQQPKRNKLTIRLDEFEKGEYLSWFVTTQAAFKVIVTLKDDTRTYFSKEKEGVNIAPPLHTGYGEYTGKNLVLEISIPQSDEIRPLSSMHTMINDTGKILGHSFTCCGEDWTDNDYNDFYINVVGWKSKK